MLVCLLGLHPITLLPLRWRVIIYNQPKTLLLEVVLPDFDLNSLSDLRIGANEYLPSAISFNLVQKDLERKLRQQKEFIVLYT